MSYLFDYKVAITNTVPEIQFKNFPESLIEKIKPVLSISLKAIIDDTMKTFNYYKKSEYDFENCKILMQLQEYIEDATTSILNALCETDFFSVETDTYIRKNGINGIGEKCYDLVFEVTIKRNTVLLQFIYRDPDGKVYGPFMDTPVCGKTSKCVDALMYFMGKTRNTIEDTIRKEILSKNPKDNSELSSIITDYLGDQSIFSVTTKIEKNCDGNDMTYIVEFYCDQDNIMKKKESGDTK